MSQALELDEWIAFTDECINALLEDGSAAHADYGIEHHFASDDFDSLERAAVDLFKGEFEITDPEEFETEEGDEVVCFTALNKRPLNRDMIIDDIKICLAIADKHDVVYDGWGTEFIESH